MTHDAHGPESGAGDESRTRDLNLGKVALYQLSYSRVEWYCLDVWILFKPQQAKNNTIFFPAPGIIREVLEAQAGIEPTYTDLQSAA